MILTSELSKFFDNYKSLHFLWKYRSDDFKKNFSFSLKSFIFFAFSFSLFIFFTFDKNIILNIILLWGFLFSLFFVLIYFSLNEKKSLAHSFKNYLTFYSTKQLTNKEIDFLINTSSILGLFDSLHHKKGFNRLNSFVSHTYYSLQKNNVMFSHTIRDYYSFMIVRDKYKNNNDISIIFFTLFAIFLPSNVISKNDKKRIINHSISVNGFALSYLYTFLTDFDNSMSDFVKECLDKNVVSQSIHSFVDDKNKKEYFTVFDIEY